MIHTQEKQQIFQCGVTIYIFSSNGVQVNINILTFLFFLLPLSFYTYSHIILNISIQLM